MKQKQLSKKHPIITKNLISHWLEHPVTVAYFNELKTPPPNALDLFSLDKSCEQMALVLAQARAIRDLIEDVTSRSGVEWMLEEYTEEFQNEAEQREENNVSR